MLEACAVCPRHFIGGFFTSASLRSGPLSQNRRLDKIDVEHPFVSTIAASRKPQAAWSHLKVAKN